MHTDPHHPRPPLAALSSLLTDELSQPVPEAARVVAEEIRARHGESVEAILFYGSCLRTQQMSNAVLDFYVLVRSYRDFYTGRQKRPLLRWLNAVLPPNVFYIEVEDGTQAVRAKYAVIAIDDFEYATTPSGIPAIIWARFCQPVRLVFARNGEIFSRVVAAATQAALTFLSRAFPFFAHDYGEDGGQPFLGADLWHRGFRETYRTEFRTERPETIRALYEASPERYDEVARLGLRALEQQGVCRYQESNGRWQIALPPFQRRKRRVSWNLRVVLAKCLYAIRLFKTALTFDDWLPYVLWKLGRHTGVWVELTERQRRHPLIWGWPVVFRLLRQRALR